MSMNQKAGIIRVGCCLRTCALLLLFVLFFNNSLATIVDDDPLYMPLDINYNNNVCNVCIINNVISVL